MVNDLKELMQENVAAPPSDSLDLASLVAAGRRRVRARRNRRAAGAAVLAAGVAVGALALPHGTDHAASADHPPAPDAPTLQLSDATGALEGRDYRVLASYTNHNLDRANGQYYYGVTDDGMVLFGDGYRLALMDPTTGAKDSLPERDLAQTQRWPVELGADRLVLLTMGGGSGGRLEAQVYDRASREWSTVSWPGLPPVDLPRAVMAPDGRLYVSVPATRGAPPPGGWPTGSDGEAEDAGAQGDTYHLWSVSLSDDTDVRDEGLTVGDVAFTDTSMVWTDSTNGAAGLVHVRDLATGSEHSFDPHAGARCNLLSFGATDDRVVMGEYCGTYAGGVRDDRVQILTTDGDQVATIQDSGIDGSLNGTGGTSDLVEVVSYDENGAGTYVYDLADDRFVRLSDAVSKFALAAPAPGRQLVWNTPVNHGHGGTQTLGELLP